MPIRLQVEEAFVSRRFRTGVLFLWILSPRRSYASTRNCAASPYHTSKRKRPIMTQSIDLTAEKLETRQMMAGDVSVSVNSGDLIIEGDDGNNELIIQGTGVDGEFALYAANGTSVNGYSSIVVAGVTDDIRIHLRDGNNKLGLNRVDVPDDLRIRLGNGDDEVAIENLAVGDDADIRTGGGDDAIMFRRGRINDRFTIRTGAGADEIGLSEVGSDRTAINTGRSADEVAVVDSVFNDKAIVSMGAGDDLLFFAANIGRLRANGSAGVDAATVDVAGERGFEFGDVHLVAATIQIDPAVGLIAASLDLGTI
jgi:hypothetical protein